MITPERRQEILKRLQEVASLDYRLRGDPAHDHPEADQLLLELIDDPEVSLAFNNIDKWYE
jgi:hypothetical protein